MSAATTAPRLSDDEVRAMAAAIQTGADGVFTDWHQALHDTAEQYAGQAPAVTVVGVR